MKALRLVEVGRLELVDLPMPTLPKGWALVEVKACGICMTDVHMYVGEFPVKMPVTLGHEFSGVVRDFHSAGEATYHGIGVSRPVREGDRVAVNPLLYCGSCSSCLSGRPNLCHFPRALGGAGDVVIDGAFAEHVAVPISSLGPLPDKLAWEKAALVEPVACCLHGINRSRIRQGDVVVVVGTGVIGLILVQLASLHGAGVVIAVEPSEVRRGEAKKAGANEVLNPSDTSFMDTYHVITGGRGADVVIEAVGSPQTAQLALSLVKKGGLVNLFGVAPQDATFPCNPFKIYFEEIDLIGTYALTPDTFRRSLALLGSGRVDVKHLITHRLPIDKAADGFELVKNRVGLKKIIFPRAEERAGRKE